jgi:release factor family 2
LSAAAGDTDVDMETSALRPAYEHAGPLATVLVDVSQDSENGAHEHELRVRAACDQLVEQGAGELLVERVRERLLEPPGSGAPLARLVVAADDEVVLDEVASFRVDQPTATYDLLPDLAPWVAHRDSAVTFVLAIVDHEGGDVALYDSDVPEPEDQDSVGGVEEEHVHKVPVGGWSALRYQHTTENVWAANAEKVVEAVQHHVRAGHHLVLLAGDPQSRGMVRDGLADTKAEVVELESGTRNADGGDEALQQAIREALLGVVVRRRLETVHRLREQVGRGGAGAAGVRPVAEALVKGQVQTLLLDPGPAAEERLDPADHPGLPVPGTLPHGELRADLVLVASAVLTDAEVTTIPAAALGSEPFGALLRWEERPGNEPPAEEV